MRAIFLDRDGTINIDKGYSNKIEDLSIIVDERELIRKLYSLKTLGFLVIVVSNQAGASLGYFSEEDVVRFNEEINRRLNFMIDDFFFCPHRKDEGCGCRKPETGLIKLAEQRYGIIPHLSWVIGDKSVDIELASRVGARSVLVLTGHGKNEMKDSYPDYVARDINHALDIVVEEMKDELIPVVGFSGGKKLFGVIDKGLRRNISREYEEIYVFGEKRRFEVVRHLTVDFVVGIL